MALNDRTTRQIRAARIKLDGHLDAHTRALAQAWSGAWDEIADEWSAAIEELLTLGEGEWPTRTQINRAKRASRALKLTADALQELATSTKATVEGSLPALMVDAEAAEKLLGLSQLPDSAIDWARVDPKALDAIVKRSTGQVESLTRTLPREQVAVMKQTLIRGVATGENPRETARLMVKRLGGDFDGGLRRAEVIARTEMIDAHRAAAHASRKANADVLSGWLWTCAKSARSCPACLAMDGQRFDVDESGPNGHPCCRCTATPITKSWRDLGFDIEEPTPTYVTGRDWFDEQPRDVQIQIMGAERLRRLRSGELRWDEIAMVKAGDGWRDSVVVRPLGS